MSALLPEGPTVQQFFANLAIVPWFSRLGMPIARAPDAKRTLRWEDWPGPDDDAVAEIAKREQALYEEIIADHKTSEDELRALWERIHAQVFARATTSVPYDPKADAWHAPSAAVWHAAWTAGLVGLCLRVRRPIPADLSERWSAYLEGHWPCGYESTDDDARLGPLPVY